MRVNIHPAAILRARGLGDNTAARRHLAATIARLSDPYVPMQQGILKNTCVIETEGREIEYRQPYAHYRYWGESSGVHICGTDNAALSENLAANFYLVFDAGPGILMALGEGVTNALPSLIQHVPEIVISIADCINKSAPKLLTCALQLITQLAWGLIENIPVLVAAIPKIIEALFKAFTALNWLSLGSTLIKGISSGIKSAVGFVKKAAAGIKDAIKNRINELPTELLIVGQNIVRGLGNGLKAGIEWVKGMFANHRENGIVDGNFCSTCGTSLVLGQLRKRKLH